MNQNKTCLKCGETKLTCEFTAADSAPDGRRATCKECEKITKALRKQGIDISGTYFNECFKYINEMLKLRSDLACQRIKAEDHGTLVIPSPRFKMFGFNCVFGRGSNRLFKIENSYGADPDG